LCALPARAATQESGRDRVLVARRRNSPGSSFCEYRLANSKDVVENIGGLRAASQASRGCTRRGSRLSGCDPEDRTRPSGGCCVGIDALASAAKTRRSTAQAAADELVRDGSLIQSGAGKRGSPFVYYLSPKALEDDDRAERKPVPTHTLTGDEKVEMPLALQPRGNGQVHDGQLDPMLRAALEAFPGAYVVDGDG